MQCLLQVSTQSVKSNSSKSFRRQSEISITDIFTPWPRKFSSISQYSSSPNSGRQGSMSHHEEMRINRHIRVVRVLFLNVVVVLLMWLPITIAMMLIFVDGRRPNEDTDFFLRSHHFVVALTIAVLNTVVNPLLYGVLSDSFRTCLLRMWCLIGSEKDAEAQICRENFTPSSAKNVLDSIGKNSRKQSFGNSTSEIPNDAV